jgi:pimeloyl-[acyl-carrier protein] methyl ester esterase
MAMLLAPDGANIYYEESRTGRPLVLLHGWAGSGRFWQFQLPLAGEFRLIIPDLRGHGRSGGEYTLEHSAADLAALFRELDLSDALLAGWSMGGQVALAAVPALRERLAGLVLVACPPKYSISEDYPFGLPPSEVKGLSLLVRRDPNRALGDFFGRMFAEGELSSEQYQRIVHEVVMSGRKPQPEAARAALAELDRADLRGILPSIGLPTLLVHGDADSICPPSASAWMAGQIPGARLELLPGVGHAPHLSRPEAFNALVMDFGEACHDGH